jgi:hypothetical protein
LREKILLGFFLLGVSWDDYERIYYASDSEEDMEEADFINYNLFKDTLAWS